MHRLLLLVFSAEAKIFCISIRQLITLIWSQVIYCSLYQLLFLKPNDDWLQAIGKLNPQLFWNNNLHLSKTGYRKFTTSLFNLISSCNTSKATTFDLRKIEKFLPLSKTSIHISTKKNIHYFKKHKFFKPKYIHTSLVQYLHAHKVSVPVPGTVIAVVSSPLFYFSEYQ